MSDLRHGRRRTAGRDVSQGVVSPDSFCSSKPSEASCFESKNTERNEAEIYGLRKLRVRDMSVSSMRKYPEPFAGVNRKLSVVVRVCVKI